MSEGKLFSPQVSYTHDHYDLEGFVCPKCGWRVPKISVTEVQDCENEGNK